MSSVNEGGTPPPPVKTKPYKAVGGGAVTFLFLIGQALDPAAAHHPVTWVEWLVVIVGAGFTAGTVYGITNPAAVKRALQARGEFGAMNGQQVVVVAVIAAVIVLGVLLLLGRVSG